LIPADGKDNELQTKRRSTVAAVRDRMPSSTVYKHRFDFEIGYLIKSPCRNCEQRPQFPACIASCRDIDRIQSRLAGSVSLSSRGSKSGSIESCAIENRGWEGK